jgi:hypothetical protein
LADFDPRELHFLDREEAIGYCMKITAAALRAFQQMKTSILNLRDRINFFRMYPSGAFAGTSHTLGVVDSIQTVLAMSLNVRFLLVLLGHGNRKPDIKMASTGNELSAHWSVCVNRNWPWFVPKQ